jgi:hypothetical protein
MNPQPPSPDKKSFFYLWVLADTESNYLRKVVSVLPVNALIGKSSSDNHPHPLDQACDKHQGPDEHHCDR